MTPAYDLIIDAGGSPPVFVVTCRELPEIWVTGTDAGLAIFEARQAMDAACAARLAGGEDLPPPSPTR